MNLPALAQFATLPEPHTLWIILCVFLCTIVLASAALIYHWRTYALGWHLFFRRIEQWYIGGAILLICAAILTLFLYTVWI
jgi:hypothetical protein